MGSPPEETAGDSSPQSPGGVLTREQLPEILELHRKWAESAGAEGQKAELAGCNLARAELQGANLHGADLREASLEGAKLKRLSLDQNVTPELTARFAATESLAAASPEPDQLPPSEAD